MDNLQEMAEDTIDTVCREKDSSCKTVLNVNHTSSWRKRLQNKYS